MSTRTENWLLYVDESGDFAGDEGTSVIAGLLVRGEESADASQRLRHALARTFPLSPWPPHASVLNQPASRVYFALKDAGTQRAPHEAAALAAIASAVGAVNASAHDAAIAFRETARRGEKPRFELLVAVGEILRRDAPMAWGALRTLVENERCALQALLRGAAEQLVPGTATIVAAVARRAEPDHDAAIGDVERDAYVDALETLLERTVALVREEHRAAGTDVRIWVRAATRNVGVLGYRRIDLNAGHIVESARRAARALPALPGRVEPRVVSQELITRYDATVHPGVVLADYLANALLFSIGTVSSDRTPWTTLARTCQSHVKLPVSRSAPMLGGDVLPTIAVSRYPREAIVAALRGEPVTMLGAERALWAREQAGEWITSFTRAREA